MKFEIETFSPCPVCNKILESRIFEENNHLTIKKTCPEHGDFSYLFSNYPAFYKYVYTLKDRLSEKDFLKNGEQYLTSDTHLKYVHEVYIDLTENCNLTCPQCFAAANTLKEPRVPKEKIFELIPRLKKYMPLIGLCGGEPTLHEDLIEIISRFSEEGFIVRLLTNGIKLRDDLYVKELKKAGLKWIILQFDGFKEDTYKLFRGRELLNLKLEVIKKLSDNHFYILLAVMIGKGINDDEIERIINFCTKVPYIVQIGFLPCANQGRHLYEQLALEPNELMDKIEIATKKMITKKDFFETLKLGKFLYRVTGNSAFKPRTCQFGVYVYHDNNLIIPIHRFIKPLFLLKHLSKIPQILKIVKHILKWNTSPFHPNLIGITIERFRDSDTIDLNDATNCTKAYLTEKGAIPNCIYNSVYRGTTNFELKNEDSFNKCR